MFPWPIDSYFIQTTKFNHKRICVFVSEPWPMIFITNTNCQVSDHATCGIIPWSNVINIQVTLPSTNRIIPSYFTDNDYFWVNINFPFSWISLWMGFPRAHRSNFCIYFFQNNVVCNSLNKQSSQYYCCHISVFVCLKRYSHSRLLYRSWVFVAITLVKYTMRADNWVRYGIRFVFACLRITSICDYGHYAELPGSTKI